jgi:hypothetical protein
MLCEATALYQGYESREGRHGTLCGLWKASKEAERSERVMHPRAEEPEPNATPTKGKGIPKKTQVERAESMLQGLGKGRRIGKELAQDLPFVHGRRI